MAPRKYFEFRLPSVRAEDENGLVDQQTNLRIKCGQERDIIGLYEKLLECNDRVSIRAHTTETCTQELFDYVQELDHCVSHSLFKMLK